MASNRFLVQFPERRQGSDKTWIEQRLLLEEQVKEWCRAQINETPGYPYWDIQYGSWSYPDSMPAVTGVFIFSDESRTAFRLRFGL